ncbi:hypothetical protein DAEQUDRAFT_375501 [Daedalea quercina L-15889]|uniref:Uncharacterized protein n=1 Tax=Daedalea quercina L-15889 TaxID=1314783 RepID=A0A165P7Y3_9APHY|nr:hypothetical protein DAEQUDRAFT_375501 [Daedalea quercina L-15889]
MPLTNHRSAVSKKAMALRTAESPMWIRLSLTSLTRLLSPVLSPPLVHKTSRLHYYDYTPLVLLHYAHVHI